METTEGRGQDQKEKWGMRKWRVVGEREAEVGRE